LFLFFSCQNAQENIALEIYVANRLSEMQPNATVTLYANQDDWLAEKNPLQESKITDKDGKVRFFRLKNGIFYIDVKKEASTNWEGKATSIINTTRSFDLRSDFLIITQNQSSLLASAEGKKWKATAAYLNGEDIFELLDDCITDNLLIFYKGSRKGIYEEEENTLKCDSKDPQIVSGTWEIDELGTTISTKTSILSEKLNIISLDENQLVINKNFLGYTIEIIYQKQ